MVVHACNPNYLGSRDQENYDLKPAWFKKLASTHINKQAGHGGKCL
jgi:hypothetical protein